MPKKLRPVRHHDEMSLVQHLTELRSRIFVALIIYIIAFGLAFWQNTALLDVLNHPLKQVSAQHHGGGFEDLHSSNLKLRQALTNTAAALDDLRDQQGTGNTQSAAKLDAAVKSLRDAAKRLPAASGQRQPVTLGVGEPFSMTLTVTAAFALLITLPFLLYQIYAFVLPAFTPHERRVAFPAMVAVPGLFIAGVVFAYFGVLPPAIKFLQSFNDSSFDILVQARDYYRFELLVMLSLGVLFQIPVVVLALTSLGILSVRQLRHTRRYAVLVIAIVAMLLPGTDPISMLLAMVPLLVLYEASILLASLRERKKARKEEVDVS